MIWELEKKLNKIIRSDKDFIRKHDDKENVIVEECHDFVINTLKKFPDWLSKNCELKNDGWYYNYKKYRVENLVNFFIKDVIK